MSGYPLEEGPYPEEEAKMDPERPLNDEQQELEGLHPSTRGNRTLLISVVSALAGALVTAVVIGFTLGYGRTKTLNPSSSLPPPMSTPERFPEIPTLPRRERETNHLLPSNSPDLLSPMPSLKEEANLLKKSPTKPPSPPRSLNPPPPPPGFKLPPLTVPTWNKPLVVEPYSASKSSSHQGKGGDSSKKPASSNQPGKKMDEEGGSTPRNRPSPPEFKSPLLKGLMALEQGHLDSAIAELKKAVEENPKDPVSHLLLHNLYERKMILAEKLEEEELYRKLSAQERDKVLSLLQPKPFNPEELPAALSNP